MSRRSSRRRFLQQSAAAAVGFWAAGGVALANRRGANDELRIAGIGVGGKGRSDITQAANHGKVVAICDIDESDYGLAGAAKALGSVVNNLANEPRPAKLGIAFSVLPGLRGR